MTVPGAVSYTHLDVYKRQEYTCEAAACLEFEPVVFKQMAGLILMYDTDNYLCLLYTSSCV